MRAAAVDRLTGRACHTRMTSYGASSRSLFRYVLLGGACCSVAAIGATGWGGQPSSGDRPAAVLDGQGIGWPEVAPLLAEAAGSGVLEELILERGLEQACRAESIVIGQAELQAERDLLVSTLARAAQVPASEGERLVGEVRATRGLGERRFAGLLARNAMLRALVRKAAGPAGIVVSGEDIDQAYQLRYGDRVRARMILVRSQERASEASKRIASGASFADVAAEFSADPSRLRGGLLDPISPADPSYPVAFRRALADTDVGMVSPPLMVMWDAQPGFAIIRVEERITGNGPDRVSVASELEAEVRSVRERAAMDRIARSIIDEQAAKLSVLDSGLEWSWRNRRGAER